jgi:small subunit ribosomal protein S1
VVTQGNYLDLRENMSKESFAQLFESSMSAIDMRPGAVISATIVDINNDRVTLNAGLKSDAILPITEFRNEPINVGDQVEVVVETVENGFGETRLSREKAKRARAWITLEEHHKKEETVTGLIIERVKGGFTVEIDSVYAFLPGSLVDIKPVRDPGYLEGKELEFKIIKMDQKRNNIVVSRRAVMEGETSAERQARLEELQEGQEIVGLVKNITDYGAFVDLGGVDGLLHITDMAWKRVRHPSELLNVGDEVKVKILKVDREKNRVSLGMKQLGEDPWENIARRYPANTRIFGRITNITDYGCFVELEEGVEGLVHMSEMDWTNKNIHPSKVVQSGEEVQVMVLEINEERRRISLGIKQCKSNPWEDFSSQHQVGDKISGNIRSITDFGMFVGLAGEIDGLVHLSDLSWNEAGEQAVRNFKKGDEVHTIILGIDADRERISLGIKQLESDPIGDVIDGNDANAIYEAKVLEVDAKQATLSLKDDIVGVLRVSEYSHERTESLSAEISVDSTLEVKIINVDRKTRTIYVSHKALQATPQERIEQANAANNSATNTTLGDLLKEQMNSKDS